MNYHDLLGVGPDASAEEIRSAWQAKIADVDPSDWRFAAYNEALTELLRQHATAVEATAVEDTPVEAAPVEAAPVEAAPVEAAPVEATPVGEEPVAETSVDEAPLEATPVEAAFPDEEPVAEEPVAEEPERARSRGSWTPPLWLLAALAVLAAVCVASAAVAWSKPSARGIEDQARTAQSAAESAATAILSYDYRTLDQSEQAADSVMTPDYRTKKYAPYFKVVRENAPNLQAVVNATVVSSGIVRADQDHVQVLVLFDQSTVNKTNAAPLVNENHATFTMEKDGGDWLVSNITT